jgi:small subunit ribosomal protein S6
MGDKSDVLTVQNYELMVIFLADIGEAAINKELDELRKYISSNGGAVLNEDTWGVKDLAFHIKKQDRGFYYVMSFSLDTLKVAEMQRGLVLNPVVIRALMVKMPEKYVFRTFAEYQDEEEKAKLAKEEAKREKESKKNESGPKPRTPKFEKKPEVKAEVKPAAPKEEVKAEVKEEKKPKKAAPSKIKLEEVDAKLKSIIDDPDITL